VAILDINKDEPGSKSDILTEDFMTNRLKNETDCLPLIREAFSDLHDYIFLIIHTKKHECDYLYLAQHNLVNLV